MLYPVYVHEGDVEHAHSVTIPDFPGCFSAADNWDELPAMVQESIELYCEGEDMDLPEPSSLEQLIKKREYNGGFWMMLDINISKLNLKPVQINIYLPERLLSHIDDACANNQQMTRSGFLAMAAQKMLSVNTID
ncbi:MAG: HicB family protein [Candidatus Parabeggiatoa sp. nov. 3]|nr:MAG: HicB family protein [Gammaproteobacteria bacterium]RKZ63740.1 MAG: HicB family protein [Gammaproteobacteria bacterium]RKZ90067.1 MAG: HicB family protein [Gammaproteobacteria bacterium]